MHRAFLFEFIDLSKRKDAGLIRQVRVCRCVCVCVCVCTDCGGSRKRLRRP